MFTYHALDLIVRITESRISRRHVLAGVGALATSTLLPPMRCA